MAAKQNYTQAEDSIIIEEIENSPNNLTNAFYQASKRLKGRSPDAIRGRYESYLKTKIKIFMLVSNNGAVVNIKTTARKKKAKSMKMEMIEFALEKLSKEEKQFLIKRLQS